MCAQQIKVEGLPQIRQCSNWLAKRPIRVELLMLTSVALEQTAALVEGKVTPRLSALLDGIKDEKKVSLAVADPKLGTYDCTTGDYSC